MNQEAKIDKIYDTVTDLKIELATHMSNQKAIAEKLKDHDAKITILEAARNQSIGSKILKNTLFGTISGAIGAALVALFKHI